MPINETAPPEAPSPRKPPRAVRWKGELRVAEVLPETPTVKTFRLVNPAGGEIPFHFVPGQFLTLTVAPRGARVNRAYTISSSPARRDAVDITVKREEGGVVSDYLCDEVKPGQLLEVHAPFGAFTFDAGDDRPLAMIAGGVGAAPFISALRGFADAGWPGDAALILSCRTPDEYVFRRELEALAARLPRFKFFVTLTRADATEWSGPRGRISRDFLLACLPDIARRHIDVCGSDPMVASVLEMLRDLGVPDAAIRHESFGGPRPDPHPAKA